MEIIYIFDLFQITFVLNMSKITKMFSLDRIDLFVELHAKDQSKMNQGWSYHDLYRLKIRKQCDQALVRHSLLIFL